MIRNVLKTLGSFRSAVAAGVGLPFLLVASAYAQAPAPAPEATAERVIVTGSYIPTAETESALPVTVYTAEVLQKQGANTPIEGLRQLPSFVGNAATENNSNAGDGTATINLRGIGDQNTLTLINGRRMNKQLGTGSDINLIPIGAVSRVEVLKDGASAVYGADGVAGVVNFIMLNGPGEKPYEGAEIFALYGNTTENDAHVRQVWLRGGVTGLDGKVAIAAEGEYYSRANLYSRDREIATTGDTSNNPNGGLGFGGSNSNSPTFGGRVSVGPGAVALGAIGSGRLVLDNLSNNAATPGSYRRFEPGASPTIDPPAGTLPGDFPVSTDPSRFNFRDFTPAIPAMEKASYFLTGRYKIFGDGLQLYGDVLYSHVKQDNGLAGAPFVLGEGAINNSNFNPFGATVTRDPVTHQVTNVDENLTSLAYRLQQELGGRRSFFDKEFYHYVAGVNGDFNIKDNSFISHFGYDSGFVYEQFAEEEIDSGDGRQSYIESLIDPTSDLSPNAGTFNPFIGQHAPTTGTVPIYNNTNPAGAHYKDGVSVGTGSYNNNLAALDWTNGGASYVGHSFFYERTWDADIKLNAHLFPNLWNGGIDIAGGYDHHEINQKVISDPIQASNDQLGFNQVPLRKFRQEVDAWFFELGIPLVTSSMNIPFVRSLDLDIAWRREEFSDSNIQIVQGSPPVTSGSFVNENPDENFGGSPRVSLRYQPIADVTLRASWGQSFRSPFPAELFAPTAQDFPNVFSPQQGTFQPQDGVWGTGNPNLKPETTDSYSFGVVWTPKFVPGFTMTVDAYQMFTTNLIVSADNFAQVLLTNGVLDPNPVCDGTSTTQGIVLAADGTVDCINSVIGNAGKRFVEGLDVTAAYEIPTDHWGKFTISGGYNHFFAWKAQATPDGPDTSFLGNYNNGTLPLAPGAIPWNKGYVRGEWEWHNFDFVATGNYIGDFRDDPAFDTIVRDAPRNVDSYITLDMQLSYEFKKPEMAAAGYSKDAKDMKDAKSVPVAGDNNGTIWQRMLWNTKLTAGVVDAFDRQPPSVIGAFNDNYDTSLYSIRNRYWYVSLTKKF